MSVTTRIGCACDNRAVLEPMLEEIFRSRPAAHWIEALTREGIPVTLVRNLREVVEDEHTHARNMLPVLNHAEAGQIRVTGVPVQLSESGSGITVAASKLGADSADILTEFLSTPKEEIERLRRDGVIA